MVLAIESAILCGLFTLLVYLISRDPLKELYNYPPAIQERVKSMEEYRDRIPAKKKKPAVKIAASVLFVIVLSLILRYINGYTTFLEGFGYGLLLWTVVNLFDAVVLDIIWFCHDPRFVIKGTEDMVRDYRDYRFHMKGFFIGEALALIVCAIAGLAARFIL
ncbi:MAG: hypothetical protein J5563_03020 [Clostridia bacterium]|nr:hypothetical protein [Clostridia bacterium]